ncbi:MAG: sulfite exporter TauE/SafE family protein [Clostridium sp.]|jgi:sulfite exporter TauE/SafE/copper chaperone CopZ|nr:sulfite exporter TauE/SafE family protein [Clostridium sp.]
MESKHIRIGGMSCDSCARRIERALLEVEGVASASVSYSSGCAELELDANTASDAAINAAVTAAGYTVLPDENAALGRFARAAGFILIIGALYYILSRLGVLNLLVPSRLAEAGMGYGMLFVVGLLTSVHCVAMCGGINLSQCLPRTGEEKASTAAAVLRPTLLYNLGRVLGYTIVGLAAGALGSVISFSATAQGVLKLLAGVFMLIMGLNMLGVFPWLHKLMPRMPQAISKKLNPGGRRGLGPLAVGLLNGLMPCGPLQAMQLYALSTGSALAGGLAMLLFSLGTVPLMFGLGALSSLLSKKFSRVAMTVGAVLVAVLGLAMLTQGAGLAGIRLPTGGASTARVDQAELPEIVDGVQLVESTLQPGRYPAITVRQGTAVKWVVDAPQGSINGCNYSIRIPKYGIEYSFQTGENVIEFMPTETGSFRYSCWMGMISGTITVVAAEITEAETNG